MQWLWQSVAYKYLDLLISHDLSWSEYNSMYYIYNYAIRLRLCIIMMCFQPDIFCPHHINQRVTRSRSYLECSIVGFTSIATDSNALLQMYRISLIKPHLEYGSLVQNSYKASDVRLLEGVQKFILAENVCKELELEL